MGEYRGIERTVQGETAIIRLCGFLSAKGGLQNLTCVFIATRCPTQRVGSGPPAHFLLDKGYEYGQLSRVLKADSGS